MRVVSVRGKNKRVKVNVASKVFRFDVCGHLLGFRLAEGVVPSVGLRGRKVARTTHPESSGPVAVGI